MSALATAYREMDHELLVEEALRLRALLRTQSNGAPVLGEPEIEKLVDVWFDRGGTFAERMRLVIAAYEEMRAAP